MDLPTLQSMEPTMDADASMELWAEILMELDWRCYSSAQCSETVAIVDRFIRFHATTPGWISTAMVAFRPMAVIRGSGGGYAMWGAVFLNGAVITITDRVSGAQDLLCYIEEATAAGWKYPDDGWVSTSSMFSATPQTPS